MSGRLSVLGNVAGLVVVCLVGCGGEPQVLVPSESPCSNDSIEIVDGIGRTVSLPSPATRIVSLGPGFTETLFQIGCGHRVILKDRWSDFPSEAASIPVVDAVNPSVERIVGFRPDLVLMYFSDDRHVAGFTALGIPVAVFDPADYDTVAGDVIKIGSLCGRPAEAETLAAQMRRSRDELGDVVGSGRRPVVYVEIDGSDPGRPWSAAEGSFVDELVQMAGARNMLKDLGVAYPQISAEEIVRSDPDVILLANVDRNNADAVRDALMTRPGFGDMRAIRQGRIISTVDRDLLTRVGPRLAVGLRELHLALVAIGEAAP